MPSRAQRAQDLTAAVVAAVFLLVTPVIAPIFFVLPLIVALVLLSLLDLACRMIRVLRLIDHRRFLHSESRPACQRTMRSSSNRSGRGLGAALVPRVTSG